MTGGRVIATQVHMRQPPTTSFGRLPIAMAATRKAKEDKKPLKGELRKDIWTTMEESHEKFGIGFPMYWPPMDSWIKHEKIQFIKIPDLIVTFWK